MGEIVVSDQARALHAQAVICDLTLPWGAGYENQGTILPEFAEAGIDFVSLTIGVDRMSLEETVRHIAAQRARLDGWSDHCAFVRSVEDIQAARQAGKLAIGFHFQGSNPLAGQVEMVEVYYDLGVRHMLFAYNKRNMAADGCHELTDGGLSSFGLRLVAEMNRVGMIVDCTHVGYRSSMDAVEASAQPVIFSHSNADAVNSHDRNIRDDQIKACAATGGIVGINGAGHFLAEDMMASPEAMLRHIDHVANLVGPAHVAIGIDHVYYLAQQSARRTANPDTFPKGYPPSDWIGSYLHPSRLIEVTELMVQHGYGDDEILGILGGNFLRVANAVWK